MRQERRYALALSTRSGLWTARMPPGRGCQTEGRPDGDPMPTPRFLTLDDVAEILNVSWSQAYALVRRKELIAIQIGGRGQWRGGEQGGRGVLSPKKAPGGARPPPPGGGGREGDPAARPGGGRRGRGPPPPQRGPPPPPHPA